MVTITIRLKTYSVLYIIQSRINFLLLIPNHFNNSVYIYIYILFICVDWAQIFLKIFLIAYCFIDKLYLWLLRVQRELIKAPSTRKLSANAGIVYLLETWSHDYNVF